jgi:hypothetical protein
VSQPKRAADLIAGLMRELKVRGGRAAHQDALAEVLGAERAQRCRVTGFAGGKLWVEVESAPLYAELTGFRREEVRDGINRRLKDSKQKVAQVVFRMGGTAHV